MNQPYILFVYVGNWLEEEDGCVLLWAVHSTHNSRNKDKCEFFPFLSNPKLFKKWEDLSRLVRGIA